MEAGPATSAVLCYCSGLLGGLAPCRPCQYLCRTGLCQWAGENDEPDPVLVPVPARRTGSRPVKPAATDYACDRDAKVVRPLLLGRGCSAPLALMAADTTRMAMPPRTQTAAIQ